MATQVMAELYQGKVRGEPYSTVSGSERQVLRKAWKLAELLGQPVEVVIDAAPEAWHVTPQGGRWLVKL